MSKIKKPTELTTTPYVKGLFYGQPGIGKSTLALSAPAPLMIDCDRGVHRVKAEHLSDTVEVGSWQDVDDVLNELKNDNELSSQYKTLVFDTGSKLLDYMTEYLIWRNPKFAQGDGTFSLKGYGARKIMFQQLLARTHAMKKHVIFIAHEREDKDDDKRVVRPEVGGSSGTDLIKELDIVGYMEAIGKKRSIHFSPQQKFYAKNAINLPDTVQLPDTNTTPNNYLTKVVEQYAAESEKRQETNKDYRKLIEELKEKVSRVDNAEDANAIIEINNEIEHIWDSKLQFSLMLRDKIKELNLKRNDKGLYEPNGGEQ